MRLVNAIRLRPIRISMSAIPSAQTVKMIDFRLGKLSFHENLTVGSGSFIDGPTRPEISDSPVRSFSEGIGTSSSSNVIRAVGCAAEIHLGRMLVCGRNEASNGTDNTAVSATTHVKWRNEADELRSAHAMPAAVNRITHALAEESVKTKIPTSVIHVLARMCIDADIRLPSFLAGVLDEFPQVLELLVSDLRVFGSQMNCARLVQRAVEESVENVTKGFFSGASL